MTQPFYQPAPERLEIREGGGCVSLFGIPFLLAGIFMSLIAVRLVPLENADEIGTWGWPLIGLMALAFVAAGGGLVFGRKWMVLDRSRACILQQWGLLVPMRHEELSLNDYTTVALRFDKGDSDSVDRYPLVLKARSAGQNLTLYTGTDYSDARARAAQLAAFLSLPLEDATTPGATVLAPSQVNETLQDRLRAGSDHCERVAQPLEMRSQVEESDGALRICIPGPGLRPTLLGQLVIPAGILLFFAPSLWEFFAQTDTPEYVGGAFIGFIMVAFVLFPLIGFVGSVAGALRRRTCVTVTPGELVIEEREAWRTRTTRIPAGEILGLDYTTAQAGLDAARKAAEERFAQPGPAQGLPPGGSAQPSGWLAVLSKLVKSSGITVKARSGLATFGAGLPDAEVDYLHSIVKRALSSQDTGRDGTIVAL